MACYNCEHLVVENKKDGTINGCLYYCSKNKKYVNGAYDCCELYSKDIMRRSSVSNEVYNSGRHYCNGSSIPLSFQIILIIILIIIALIVNI